MNVKPDQQSAAIELLKRSGARDSLSEFRKYMAPTGHPMFANEPAAHHQLIIQHLERLERGEIQRLMILAPPNSAKSTYCSKQFPLWYLARRPIENVLCASNTQDLAETFNRERRNIVLSPQWQALAQTSISDDMQGVGHFGVQRGGSIRATGCSGAVVGFRSNINILDDPIKSQEEALSPGQLDKQWEWFHNEFRTRLDPVTGKELIISTRWAKRDIAGRLLETERGRWVVLRLPMLADSDDDPMGREYDAPLWSERFSTEFVELLKEKPLLWATQYQQTPLDESGTWVGAEHFIYTDRRPPDEGYTVIGVDLALTVGKGDWTVFVVGQLDADRNLHIIHVDRRRVDSAASVDRLFELAHMFDPMEVVIDDDNASKVFKTAMHERMRSSREGHAPFALHVMPMRGKDKEIRATSIRAMFLNGQIRILKGPWNATLVRELLEFPSGDHDDQVDALGLIGRRMPMLSAPSKPHVPADAYEGKRIRVNEDGQYVLNAHLHEMFGDRERRLRVIRRRA